MPKLRAIAMLVLAATATIVSADQPPLSGAAAIADAVLWGKAMPPSALSADLPKNVQSPLTEYLERERAFHSGLTPPPGATAEERETYERRVGIERVVFCLFSRGDSATVAPQYALDADIEPNWEGMAEMPRREARFIDRLLVDLPKPWLAPYLNLVAGHRKLCASEMDGASTLTADARRQLTKARDGGNRIVRIVADHLLTTGRCGEQ
jgi:hypothetical protein